jgi:hypothetical protein
MRYLTVNVEAINLVGAILIELTIVKRMQYNMPDLIPPLRNKADAPYVTNVSFLLCAVFYTLLGFMGAIAFDRPDALVTLNWSSYTGIALIPKIVA